MTSRKEYLKSLGYEEPLDESPFELPDGWFGGGVRNSGGNIYVRSWRTWESHDEDAGEQFEVMYDVDQDSRVALHRYTWDAEHECYTLDGDVKTVTAPEQTDKAQAEVAKELMDEKQMRADGSGMILRVLRFW
jgi:hypothetical protein